MYVTPYVGVWIEIYWIISSVFSMAVTPYVGVWIEIFARYLSSAASSSLPTWECGLKFNYDY